MTGSTQPRRRMFQMKSPAATTEMTTSRLSAGSCAAMSVLLAPATTPRWEKFRLYRANQYCPVFTSAITPRITET